MNFIRITVNNLGSVLSYHAKLTPQINIIDSCYTPEISVAIEFLLGNQSATIPKAWLRNETMISADVLLNDETYTISASLCGEHFLLTATDAKGNDVTAFYKSTLSHCLEQDTTESFDGKEQSLPLRLCWYRKPEDQDAVDNFPDRTNRLITTDAFRTHLIQYIRTFQPEPVNCKKSYQVTVDPQGKFVIFCPGIPDDIYLSETEEKLFLYLCFLNIAEFWTDIEKIRDLHHEKKPLLIQNFLEYLDKSTDISGLIARTNKLQRQVIILSSPLDEEQKKKWIGEYYE